MPNLPSAPQPTGAPPVPGDARPPVTRAFSITVTGAFFGTWVALLPATSVTLALRVQQIDPAHKAGSLSLVLGAGAAVALVAQNIFGALSDRTTARTGMRTPWIAAGALLGTASLAGLAAAPTVAALTAAWAVVQLAFNVLLAGLNPVLPDHVPSRQLARISGWVSVTSQVAGVAGLYLANAFMPNLPLAVVLPAAPCLVLVGAFLLVLKDRRLDAADRPPLRLRDLLAAYWSNPRRHPDFAWAWVSRLLVTFGNMTLTNYQVYFVQARFHIPARHVGDLVLRLSLISLACTLAAAFAGGALSDRTGRRKVFVLGSAALIAAAHLLAVLAPGIGVFAAAAAFAGLGNGAYAAVDLALVTEVLPSRTADAGKDMGVMHLANVLPQTLVPVVAPAFLALGPGGSNYDALLIAGAAAGALGALAIRPVKAVR